RDARSAPNTRIELSAVENRRPEGAAQIHHGSAAIGVVSADHGGVERSPIDLIVQKRFADAAVGVTRAVAAAYQLEKAARGAGTQIFDELQFDVWQQGRVRRV